jgi:hypothetical protein
MPTVAIARTATPIKSASPAVAPIYVDSDDNKLKMIPAGSGTTEVEVVDASSSQTLTNKTLTAPTINGQVRPVIAGSGATVALTAAMSGSLCLFDRAAGIVYTLPAAAVGLYFDFYVKTTITSNAAEIITAAAGVFISGSLLLALEATTPAANPGPKLFTGNPAASVKISMNGSTKGGVIGGRIRVESDGTDWYASGTVLATGTIETPYA